MNLNDFNELPEWNDMPFEYEGDEWKPNPYKDCCRQMYSKWNEIIIMLNGLLYSSTDIADEDSLFFESNKQIIIGDGYKVGVKIRSAALLTAYVNRMENAAIIRENAQAIKSHVLSLMMEGTVDDEHGLVVREEIDIFREMYKSWVASFTKDDYEDEWGLF